MIQLSHLRAYVVVVSLPVFWDIRYTTMV